MNDEATPTASPPAVKPGSGEAHVAVILRDIQCPGCEYNLRGLSGPVVTCPECGAAHDLAKLVTAKNSSPSAASSVTWPSYVETLKPHFSRPHS